MEQFSCCSRWEECRKENRCIHPGTEEIPAKKWKFSCSVATSYERTKQKEQIAMALIAKEKKLLLLIDGNSVMHRAFHVTPDLLSPCGKPTGAIYGTLKMIGNLVAGRKPTHLAVALDGQGPVFRKKIYPQYKANRKPKDPRLVTQLSMLPEILGKLNIKCLSAPEYEADDVIGTLAASAEDEGFKVIILSGDGDLIQLVSENITLLLSKKGVSELLDCTPETAEYLTGLMPTQVTSYKALAGDSSDNIPGASGIGKVTAKQLLVSYGFVENILNIVGSIPGKTGEKLRASVNEIRLSRELATIVRNVPLEHSPENTRLNIDVLRGTKKLSELGINNINMGHFRPQENVRYNKKPEAARVILRSNGRNDYCGVCGKYGVHCNRFAELQGGKMNILGQNFWACPICEYELIHPESYRKIQDSMANKPSGGNGYSAEGYIQGKLSF